MSLFQLVLLVTAAALFYIFFKQLFSGSYPRRGVDFEVKTEPGMQRDSRKNRLRSSAGAEAGRERVEELISISEESIRKGDYLEAKKALTSALVLDEENPEVLRRLGVAYIGMSDYLNAKETFEKIVKLDPDDDLAYSSLANSLHKLAEDDKALEYHRKSIALDGEYAPHHFNYANTLYDLGMKTEALESYRRALELDPEMEEAARMITELER